MNESLKLCYVDGNFAYFTSQTLENQWGDDWDDNPYEHNAGVPYGPGKGEYWEIKKVAFDGGFNLPHELGYCVSVERINRGEVAWLIGNKVCISAGTTLADFIRLVNEEGGDVYMPVNIYE